jgi:uncharacterized membrane protein
MTPETEAPKGDHAAAAHVSTAPPQIRRINGYLNRLHPVVDGAGKVVSYVAKPFMVELRLRDVMQIMVGATLLAVPAAFTEEVWVLGSELPNANVIAIAAISVFFIGLFVFFNDYRGYLAEYRFEFAKRVVVTYVATLVVVGVFLTLFQKCPWGVDNALALRRIVLVGLPASMSATVADMLK